MKRKLISVLIVMALVITILPLSAQEVMAASKVSYTGSTITTNTWAASTINGIISKYRNHKRYSGGGQCWGYAEKVSTKLAKSRKTKYYKGLRFTKKNFKSKCLGVKAGTHLRLSRHKKFSAYVGHSVVILKVTDKMVYWADNNYYRTNTVDYRSGSINKFMSYYSTYGYINMVRQTVQYKKG